ncbi:MAG: hypothetical protein EOO06_05405 [Chitinophagaceae bacterium]|nr:MAG: hypothetical protein EOO06_05405 [Chitinophagaceae bacterium]
MSTTTLPNASGHYISLQTAIAMTGLFRSNREVILAELYQERDILPLSETFHRDAIDELLGVPGCAGIRIYPGMDEDDKLHSILVAVNEDNEDILSLSVARNNEPVIIEVGQRCPPTCPPASDLNT